jgi:Arc/MetJ family transcription regulator
MDASGAAMGRTNIVLDDELVRKVMELTGQKTKRGAVDAALRSLVERRSLYERIKALRGIGWSGSLDELRRPRC